MSCVCVGGVGWGGFVPGLEPVAVIVVTIATTVATHLPSDEMGS